MGLFVPIVSVAIFIIVIGSVKWKDHWKTKPHAKVQKWEGETEEQIRKRKRKGEPFIEFQKRYHQAGPFQYNR
ncbi:hypothetical protein [Pontibacillus litoralis]|uniref:Uncharacterized protein n=1 Tax=Pontibacillus litoralis JSM 072002 TaxID=1385512 RepID=A0A0A5G0M9_9BACI|nr:hypothetical protein [Pontibacillus litoralis]KGX85584.1 hypothetical protein N784_08730 [Pontibacillus litoralis JSM 072002]